MLQFATVGHSWKCHFAWNLEGDIWKRVSKTGSSRLSLSGLDPGVQSAVLGRWYQRPCWQVWRWGHHLQAAPRASPFCRCGPPAVQGGCHAWGRPRGGDSLLACGPSRAAGPNQASGHPRQRRWWWWMMLISSSAWKRTRSAWTLSCFFPLFHLTFSSQLSWDYDFCFYWWVLSFRFRLFVYCCCRWNLIKLNIVFSFHTAWVYPRQ